MKLSQCAQKRQENECSLSYVTDRHSLRGGPWTGALGRNVDSMLLFKGPQTPEFHSIRFFSILVNFLSSHGILFLSSFWEGSLLLILFFLASLPTGVHIILRLYFLSPELRSASGALILRQDHLDRYRVVLRGGSGPSGVTGNTSHSGRSWWTKWKEHREAYRCSESMFYSMT